MHSHVNFLLASRHSKQTISAIFSGFIFRLIFSPFFPSPCLTSTLAWLFFHGIFPRLCSSHTSPYHATGINYSQFIPPQRIVHDVCMILRLVKTRGNISRDPQKHSQYFNIHHRSRSRPEKTGTFCAIARICGRVIKISHTLTCSVVG